MALAGTTRSTCHKRGIILTCFVDGHKRFRPLVFESMRDMPSSDSAAVPGANRLNDLPRNPRHRL
jgi:hypothetical protein